MEYTSQRAASRGFTLVELSIVLVILGLLVGGVLTGQSLIHAAELRSISTQTEKTSTAIYTFRDKYFALPGDMTNATAYWGKDTGNCLGDAGSASTPGTCNGNGDGIIGAPNYIGAQSYETYRMWQQLAMAGLLEGSFTGVTGPGSSYSSVPGENVPASKFPGVGYSLTGGTGFGTTFYLDQYYPMEAQTIINLGKAYPGDLTEGAFLTPADAYNVDMKIDDGSPSHGIYQSWKPSSGVYPGVANGDCATDNDPALAQYKLSFTGIACSFNIQVK